MIFRPDSGLGSMVIKMIRLIGQKISKINRFWAVIISCLITSFLWMAVIFTLYCLPFIIRILNISIYRYF